MQKKSGFLEQPYRVPFICNAALATEGILSDLIRSEKEQEGMRFYLNKIGGHLQELAVLAIVFVPLDGHLTHHGIVVLGVCCAFIIAVGIEMERRTR